MNPKRLLLIMFIALGSLKLHAQDPAKLSYSIDMGVPISFFDQETAPYPDPSVVSGFEKASRASFEIGGNINYALTGAFSVSSGLRYTEKGGGYKTKNPNFIYVNSISGNKEADAYNYLKYRLVYVEVPVLVKLSLGRVFKGTSLPSDVKLYGGVTGMFNIGSKFRYNVFSSDEESWESESLDGAENFLLSSVAGIEWNSGALIIYGRYCKNISDVYDVSRPGYASFNVNMHTLSFGLGFIID